MTAKMTDVIFLDTWPMIRGTVQDTENRICRLLFKLAVEQDMVINVLAAGMEIPENFILGFRLGIRLMAECMDDNDGYSNRR